VASARVHTSEKSIEEKLRAITPGRSSANEIGEIDGARAVTRIFLRKKRLPGDSENSKVYTKLKIVHFLNLRWGGKPFAILTGFPYRKGAGEEFIGA